MSIAPIFKLLADETRIRLLLLLKQIELTVAELSATLQLAQPRISTHLGKLREMKFVLARKDGVSTYYRLNLPLIEENYQHIWKSLLDEESQNPLIMEDTQRLSNVLSQRAKNKNWVDSVAGDMERQYSPGRSWEATTRALSYLLELGDVLDIGSGDGVLAELLHKRATTYTCVDSSKTIIEAAKKRLTKSSNISYLAADMHTLEINKKFDTVFLLHVLTYSENPQKAVERAASHLNPGGKLLISTLESHPHTDIVRDFGHVNNGFSISQLNKWAKKSGLKEIQSKITSIESKKPHFKVITLEAIK